MQFEHAATAGCLVQTVDVLRDDGGQAACGLPPGERLMAGIRPGSGEIAVGLGLLAPVLVPRFAAGQKCIEVDRLVLGPHAAGRTEIGNSALGARAGAGERNRNFRLRQPAGNLLNLPVFHGGERCRLSSGEERRL
ncbi:MAG TPA: hypothetical protein VGX78_15685, partial [Pirellulales bacterium]|nr:hypothetical protein [Pirellulales bacterium]